MSHSCASIYVTDDYHFRPEYNFLLLCYKEVKDAHSLVE